MAVPIPARTVSKPMDTSDDDAPASPGSRAPLQLQLAVSFAQGWVLPPFYGTIMGGATIALLSTPLYRWLLVRPRERRSAAAPAALCSLVALGVQLIGPVIAATFNAVCQICSISRIENNRSHP